jgi:hypothetical protein
MIDYIWYWKMVRALDQVKLGGKMCACPGKRRLVQVLIDQVNNAEEHIQIHQEQSRIVRTLGPVRGRNIRSSRRYPSAGSRTSSSHSGRRSFARTLRIDCANAGAYYFLAIKSLSSHLL